MKQYIPDLVILTETQASRTTSERFFQKLPFDSFFLAEPIGHVGGIMLLWNGTEIDFTNVCSNLHNVNGVVQVKHPDPSSNSLDFFLSVVYARQNLKSAFLCGRI